MLYRCSPSTFYNVVKKFSNEQKDAICSIGLGSLLQIHEKIHLRRHIIDFVVEHYSPKSGAVIVDNTTIPISLTDMVLCFGLPVVRSQIVLEGNKELIRELCDHYQIKVGYIYKATLEKMLKVDDSGEGFQRTFILYVLCMLFVPHVKQYVSEKYLHTLIDMKSVRKIAWGEFAYFTLVEAIYRVKDGKVANVGGFVLFLQHNDRTELLSKALEQISDLQRIISEHEAWRVEVEKELARRELHDTQMSCVIEDLRQKIATQDTIIETLREQVSKKETSTENEFNKRSVHKSIYVSKSPVKRGAVHSIAIGSTQRLLFLGSDSKEMNMLGSTVAKRVIINSRVKRRTHKRKCYKSYADELLTHQRIKLRKAISTLPRQPTRPSLFPSLTASQKAAVDDAQRCDSIHSMSDIVVRIEEAFVYRAAFKTLEPGGLLDDMVIDASMRILDIQQRESGPSHQKRTYYGSSHLHQFMRKCVMERKFSSGVPVRRNSAGFDIYKSDRVFIPVNRSGVHWSFVDLLRRKITTLDSMMPHCVIFMISCIEYWNGEPNSIPFTQVDIEAFRDKIAVSLLLSPLNRVRMLLYSLIEDHL
ncbi:hypothetical protein HHK36_013526 [Tetracentron sinense]|uniref:Ubiquitin-like protease family profile domain-containing protein n=1 Tax=Tetracentron sinense TaxID=13715 RepID=A0A834Z3H4_TETSI|nr:hypothetical protein HHK36_013526 [Tetracentron sinense]